VDAETSEVFPSLSDGQRAYDLEILVENVAFGLADLAAMQASPGGEGAEAGDRADAGDDAIHAAEHVRERYEQIWATIHDEPVLHPDDRQAIRNRVRKLNDLGYSVDLDLDPDATDGRVRLRMSVTTRRYHARALERRTRLRALEGQAQLLLNDLNEYGTWLEWSESRAIPDEEVAERWLREVYRPTLARIAASVGPERDLVQAYSDVLEQKWLLSEQEGRDVGLARAIDVYLELGAPAPETIPREDDIIAMLDPLELDPLAADPSDAEGEEAADATGGSGTKSAEVAPSDV
jgi:hypothetical protein